MNYKVILKFHTFLFNTKNSILFLPQVGFFKFIIYMILNENLCNYLQGVVEFFGLLKRHANCDLKYQPNKTSR